MFIKVGEFVMLSNGMGSSDTHDFRSNKPIGDETGSGVILFRDIFFSCF